MYIAIFTRNGAEYARRNAFVFMIYALLRGAVTAPSIAIRAHKIVSQGSDDHNDSIKEIKIY